MRGGVILKPLPFMECDPAGDHFTWNSMHMGGYERKLAQKGLAYYLPIKYSEVPTLKSVAYLLTGSVGLFSDAVESLVNLAGGVMALGMLRIAASAGCRLLVVAIKHVALLFYVACR